MRRARMIRAKALREAANAERWDHETQGYVRQWLKARADEAERSPWPHDRYGWFLWLTGRWGR